MYVLSQTMKLCNFNYLHFACDLRAASKLTPTTQGAANCEPLINSMRPELANQEWSKIKSLEPRGCELCSAFQLQQRCRQQRGYLSAVQSESSIPPDHPRVCPRAIFGDPAY